jgi:hypothetical protein
MRGPLKVVVAAAIAVAAIYTPAARAGGEAVVIHPSDIVRVDAKDNAVDVVVGQPKAVELSRKPKQVPIELSVPSSAVAGVFRCQTRRGRNSATISFVFGDSVSAADFAEELRAAKAKSQCNCRD